LDGVCGGLANAQLITPLVVAVNAVKIFIYTVRPMTGKDKPLVVEKTSD
jgi:hypothetical protein